MAKKEKQVKENNKHYFKEMKAELKKVVWPTPKQLVNNTVAVIAFVLIFAIIVFVLDVCFKNINNYGILPLQQKVQSSFSSSDNSDNATSENSETKSNEGTESSASEAVVEEPENKAEHIEVQETPNTSETE